MHCPICGNVVPSHRRCPDCGDSALDTERGARRQAREHYHRPVNAPDIVTPEHARRINAGTLDAHDIADTQHQQVLARDQKARLREK